MAMSNTANPVAAQVATHAAAVLTMAAPTDGSHWTVRTISWSYSATPTGGSLQIAWNDGGTNYTETYYITAGGPGQLSWPDGRNFPANKQVTVTLADGGSGIIGTIYANAFTD